MRVLAGDVLAFAQEEGRLHLAAVVEILEERAVAQAGAFKLRERERAQAVGLGVQAVAAESAGDEPVDVHPRGAAPHVLRVAFRVAGGDEGMGSAVPKVAGLARWPRRKREVAPGGWLNKRRAGAGGYAAGNLKT